MCIKALEKTFGAATLSIDVVQDIFVARSREAGVVNAAGVDGSLILSRHDQLDLTPHAVQAVVVRERSKVCDSADLLSVIPGPLKLYVLRVEVLHPTAQNQQPLHLGDLRDTGDLEERWLYWRCVRVCERRGQPCEIMPSHSHEIITIQNIFIHMSWLG